MRVGLSGRISVRGCPREDQRLCIGSAFVLVVVRTVRVQTTIIDNLDNVSNAALMQLWRRRSGEGAIAEEEGSVIVLLSVTPLTYYFTISACCLQLRSLSNRKRSNSNCNNGQLPHGSR